METKTIIYVVAAALILRVVIKVVVKYRNEIKKDNGQESP